MKELSVVTKVLIALLLCSTRSIAKEDSWHIVTLAGDTVHNCKLDSLRGTSIEAGYSDERVVVSLDSVAALFREGDSRWKTGATGGVVIGLLVGGAVGVARLEPPRVGVLDVFPYGWAAISGAVVGGAAGALIGAGLGATVSGSESVEVSELPLDKKVEVVRLLKSGEVRSARKLVKLYSNP